MSDHPQPPHDSPTVPPSTGQPLDRRYFVRLGLRTLALFVALLAFVLVLAGLQRVGWLPAGVGGASASGDTRIHTCAMHPQIRQVGPGKCPICFMALEPIPTASGVQDDFAVTITPAARRLAHIETAPAESLPVFRTIETVGSIAIDESRQATIAAYVAGRVERIFADYTGVEVTEGDHLAVLYSPELYAAQVEYVESRKSLDKMNAGTLGVVRETQQKLVENARARLVELGLSKEQMKQLDDGGKAESRLTIYAPIGGTVTEKMVDAGRYVKAGEPIYRIADLSMVWLMLRLYPEDAARIRFGQVVRAELSSLPGETFEGRVGFVDPVVDAMNRTVGVRVELVNANGRLRPGDYATARIRVPIGTEGSVYDAELANKWISPMHPQIIRDEPGKCPICGMDLVPTERYGYSDEAGPQPTSLVVPRSAILVAGTNAVLYAETEPGRFEIRHVTLGPFAKVERENGHFDEVAVVLGGVQAGEMVATSGNFLIDSQMQLAGNPSLIDPTRAKNRPAKERRAPLDSPHIHVEPIAGKTGELVEALYAAYFPVQEALSRDTPVTEALARNLRDAASAVVTSEELSEEQRQLAETVLTKSEHLHHRDLAGAREDFKPISAAVVKLAFQLRGEGADRPFTHYWCAMVEDGRGDWLQPKGLKGNPYKGAAMLTCGDVAHELPVEGDVAPR